MSEGIGSSPKRSTPTWTIPLARRLTGVGIPRERRGSSDETGLGRVVMAKRKKSKKPEAKESPAAETAESGEEQSSEEGEDEEPLLSEEEARAVREEALAGVPVPLHPPDIDAIAKEIEVISPTEVMLQFPSRDEPVSEEAQRRIMLRWAYDEAKQNGADPEAAKIEAKAVEEGAWLRIQMQPWQSENVQKETGWRVETLVTPDPGSKVDRVMPRTSQGDTAGMLREFINILRFYEVRIETEKAQLFQVELDGRFHAAIQKKDKERERYIKSMMPRIASKKTGKRIF